MKKSILFIAVMCITSSIMLAQTCGETIIVDDFSSAGSIPTEWTEVNTVDSVTVVDGRLRFSLGAAQPSAYRTFTPVSENVSVSFTEESSRNYVKCRFDIISSTGKYITSIMFGNNGVGNVQYATSLDANGLPTAYTGSLIDHVYKKNYEYTFAVALDFLNHTFDFYADGLIGGQNIPFIESSSDVAKVSITQISMYNNTGFFYFDDVALTTTDADRSLLSSGIASAISLTQSGIISPLYGYSPDAYKALKLAKEDAAVVLKNCDTNQADIDSAANVLQVAIDEYENSYIDEPVLTLYSGYDFIGAERSIKCGYYNGDLGDFEDVPVSFKLEKGYMATFAQDVDGLGFSKVYIAQDSALAINLPAELQQTISFMRVSPWFSVGKKGSLGNKTWSDPENYNTVWYYNWGLGVPYQNSGFSTPEVQYVPMSWSKGDYYTSNDKMVSIGQNMTMNHHLAFNEPDNTGQANLTVAAALEAYPRLLASGLRLGAPGVENVQYSANNDEFNEDSWIKEFMDSCVARGYRVDFIPAHDYVRRTTATYLERFEALYKRYGIPVWVTEYNYGNPNMGSAELDLSIGYRNIKLMTEAFEKADFIERYNWYYFFGENTGIGGKSGDTLNITGQFYRDLVSPAPSYIQESYEQGPYISTGIEAPKALEVGVNLYPNPVRGGVLSLCYPEFVEENDVVIHLYDVSGKELMKTTGVKELDVSHLKSGLYILSIKSVQLDTVQKITVCN